LAALLHDVGHGPFSHVFEPLMAKYLGKNHEDFVPWLVSQTEIAERLEAAGFNAKTLGRLAIGKLRDKKRPYLDQMISGGVDVDKMDYMLRHSVHTVVGYASRHAYRLLLTLDILPDTLSVAV